MSDLKMVRDVHDGIELGDRVSYDRPVTEAEIESNRQSRTRHLHEMQRRGRRDGLVIAVGDALESLNLTPDEIKAGVRRFFGKEQ